MKARYYLLSCLALAACDGQEREVEVNFDQPFPAQAPDLIGFLPRHQQRYPDARRTGQTLMLTKTALLSSRVDSGQFSGHFLDSMDIPRHGGYGRAYPNVRFEVRALAADSFRVRAEGYDTLLNVSTQRRHKLRHYRGWYYLSLPATDDSTKWEVQRLGIVAGKVVQQVFNPDSLRILALDPAIVQRRRYPGKLILTLTPHSRQAIRQVSSYDGLWLELRDYLISVLGDSQVRPN